MVEIKRPGSNFLESFLDFIFRENSCKTEFEDNTEICVLRTLSSCIVVVHSPNTSTPCPIWCTVRVCLNVAKRIYEYVVHNLCFHYSTKKYLKFGNIYFFADSSFYLIFSLKCLKKNNQENTCMTLNESPSFPSISFT